MPLTREERKLLHQKSKQPTFGTGKPGQDEGYDGDISFRKVEGSGTVEYVKENGSWVAVASSGEMPAVRMVGGGSGGGGGSSGISSHSSLSGLANDDHEDYVRIGATSPRTGTGSLDLNTTTFDLDATGALTLDSATSIAIGTNADKPIDIDATTLDIDASDAVTIDSTSTILISGDGGATFSDDTKAIVYDGSGNLDFDAVALDMDLIDSSSITITSSEGGEDLTIQQIGGNDSSIFILAAGTGSDAIKIDATAGSMEIGVSLADEKTLTLGNTGSTYLQLIPHGTAGSEKILIKNTAGSADDALKLWSAAGGITLLAASDSLNIDADGTASDALNIDSAGGIDIDAEDEITIDTNSADGHITITSAHTAGQSILISANANAGSILDIDAGIIDIDVQDEIEIATTSADGHIILASAHTSGLAFHIDANEDAASEVQIDAGILDIDVTGAISIDSSAGSISMNVVDEQTVSIGLNAASETVWTPSNTAGTEQWSTIVTSGDTDGADAAGSILLSSVAGGIGLAWNDGMDLWAEGGRFVVTANENPGSAGEVIKLHADAGANQTIVLLNDEGTSQSAITLTSTAGGIDLNANAGKDITLNGGQVKLTGAHDTAETIHILADAGNSGTLVLESAKCNDDASILVISDTGGIKLSSVAKDIDMHIDEASMLKLNTTTNAVHINNYAQTLFEYYKLHIKGDGNFYTHGEADYKQNYSMLSQEYGSASFPDTSVFGW